MSIQQKPGHIDDKITEKDVITYLRAHPDFFEKNKSLLRELTIPHLSGGAVSLVERQVDVLRKDNKKLARQLEELVRNARDNEKLAKQVFQLTLALMGTNNLSQVFTTLQDVLRRDFKVDAVSIKLVVNPKNPDDANMPEFVKSTSKLSQFIDKNVKQGRSVCGRFKQEQLTYLFAEKAGQIKSAAILPLGEEAGVGLLAIGSHDEQRFYAGMGTVYLNQLSAIISKSIQGYLVA